MKRTIMASALALALLAGPAAAQPPSVTALPGYVDFERFGDFDPADMSVEINLSGALLSMLATALEDEDDEFSELVAGLQLVRVNVFEITAGSAPPRERATAAVNTLRREGWEAVVSIRDDEDLHILLRTDGDLVVGLLAMFGGERSFGLVNIVGELDPAQIGRLARQFDIEPLEDLEIQGRRRNDDEDDG